MFEQKGNVQNQKIMLPVLMNHGIELWIKREDQLDPWVSGNKFRKLTYNIEAAKLQGAKQLLTYGGAYSNHIAATASAGKRSGLQTIGIIRGQELGDDLQRTLEQNSTLAFAHDQGMKLHCISREAYRLKDSPTAQEALIGQFGPVYIIPEGGTNALAVRGCEEILQPMDKHFDLICCAVGTGGTFAGLCNSAASHQKLWGFQALKGDFLGPHVQQYLQSVLGQQNFMQEGSRIRLFSEETFGGYARVTPELVTFINSFTKQTGLLLDPIYTAKMLYGLLQRIEEGALPNRSRVLAIHTGGLQGIHGVNQRLAYRQLPLIGLGPNFVH